MMLLQRNAPQISFILLTKFDGSSKLCFEEKSNSAIGDKIFKNGRQLIYSSAVMVSVAKCSIMKSQQKVSKISSFEPKFQRKSENQGYIKVSEKSVQQDIKKVGFLKKLI